jgi:hypothetical protein
MRLLETVQNYESRLRIVRAIRSHIIMGKTKEETLPTFCRSSNEGGAGIHAQFKLGMEEKHENVSETNSTNEQKYLVLMSRVRENIRPESISSRSIQVVVLIDEILELHLYIGDFVSRKLKLLKWNICSTQKPQKPNF